MTSFPPPDPWSTPRPDPWATPPSDWDPRSVPPSVIPRPSPTLRFDEFPNPTPRGPRLGLMVGAVVAVVALGGGLAFWLLRPTSPTPSDAASRPASSTAKPSATSSSPEADAQTRLLRALPPGYQPDVCTPTDRQEGALATVACGRNSDPGGPPAASFSLLPDKGALNAAVNGVVATSTVIECPGHIQSPGPWRRNATPQRVSGTLVCGREENNPMVAWTDNDKLVLSVARSDEHGPTLDELYAWWASHS